MRTLSAGVTSLPFGLVQNTLSWFACGKTPQKENPER